MPIPNVALEMSCRATYPPLIGHGGVGPRKTDMDGRFYWDGAPRAPVSVRLLDNKHMSVRRTLQPGNDIKGPANAAFLE